MNVKKYRIGIEVKELYGKGRFIYLMLLGVCFMLGSSAFAQNTVQENEQYKKRPTNAMASIAQGNPDEAIKNLEAYLVSFPNDAESYYCMAVAYAVKNEVSKAMKHLKRAMAAGMPAERFIAGPRTLLENVTKSKEFKDFIKGKLKRLVHGPLLGDVTTTTAKIWLRTDNDAQITISVLEEGRIISQKFEGNTSSATDFTTVVQLSGLKPFTDYSYTVEVDGSELVNNGTFKTTKRKGQPLQLKVGFGGGAGYTPWFERMWDTLAVQSFDAFFLLGDNVYIDYPEVPEAQKYCYYRRQSRPEFRRFTPNVPIYAIWDDHDFTVNDGEGGAAIDIPSWKRPVWNVFKNQWANPYYGGGNERPGCWFDFSMGDIDFIMLDCRYYRENPKEVGNPSMLGEYQKKWLKEKLKTSTATFKVISSSVPWAKNTKPGSDDTWDGFPKEREEIFSFIEENKIEGVLLLSADRHRSDAWKIERENGYALYDLMSSKLTNIHTHKLMEGSLFAYNKECSFGTLEFDTTVQDPSVTYVIKNIDNEEIHKMTIFKSQLDFKEEIIKNIKGQN
ncbi:MAG: alkaline phosphatase D family protein [Maribacter sp.]|nr:alkaline phosphatase D family protein [Maribacter sp.]